MSSRTSRPSGLAMSRPTLRLPRLLCQMFGFGPAGSTFILPIWVSPRCGSPVTACSILMTWAPHSRRTAPPDGTKPYIATSRTRTPSRGRALIGPTPGSPRGGSLDRHRQGLALEELLEAGDAHLPADAGLLVPTERRVRSEPVATVDTHGAGPDPLRDRDRPVVVGAEDGAGQAEDRVVRDPDRVVVILVADDREHRAEDLVLGDLAVRVDVGEHGRLVE